MNSYFKKNLSVALTALLILLFFTSGIFFLKSEYVIGAIFLTLFWLVLGISMTFNERLKSYSFTIMILAAVTVSMTFPEYFTKWGSFESKKLIIPLLQIITFGVGSTLNFKDFREILKMPRGVFIGIVAQFTIMPFVGLAIATTFKFPPEIAAGVILVGCSPSGLASNVMAYISKANLSLSVAITSSTTLLAPVVTPFLMKMLGGTYVSVNFIDMLWDVSKILVIPILLGMTFHYFLHKKVNWLEKIMPRISMLGIVFIIIVITAAGRESLLVVGFLLILAMFLHMTIGFFLGYMFARIFGLPEKDCRSVALEVGMQNGGLASGIAASMGKIATLGLAAAVNGPLMNTVFSIISSWWAGKEEKNKVNS